MSTTRKNTKNRVRALATKGCICLLVTIAMYGLMGTVDYNETHYNRVATVTDCKGDDVIVEDSQGNVFAFGGDGFKVGDEVVLKMYTNHTDDTIEDDEILNAKLK